MSHAIGAMHYTDRCILRLHDAIVVRKALHTAISYHAVTRECLLGIVEKSRRPKPGFQKATQDGGASMEAPDVAGVDAGGGGKGSSAVSAAIDAIEQTVNALAQGAREEVDPQPIGDGEAAEGGGAVILPTAATAPSLPSKVGRGGRGIKRKVEKEADPDNPGFDEEDAESKPKGGRGSRGGGRGRGRGRGISTEEKENKKPKVQSHASGEAAKPGKAGSKKRRTRQNDDDSD